MTRLCIHIQSSRTADAVIQRSQLESVFSLEASLGENAKKKVSFVFGDFN
jgi:hypothetical protein